MNTLAPSAGSARRRSESDELCPPAPTQAAVPPQFASLTWPVDLATVELPAPVVGAATDAPGFAPPTPQQWGAPEVASTAPPTAPPTVAPTVTSVSTGSTPGGTGWSWTPVMDADAPAPPSLRSPLGDVSIELSTLEAAFEARSIADGTAGAAEAPRHPVTDRPGMPSVSFEPAAGTITTAITDADEAAVTAVVTATVPAFVTYAPSSDYVLPATRPREPMPVEVRETVVSMPTMRLTRRRRSGRAGVLLLVVAAAISAAAYIGFREYIYGDTVVADDGTRVVEVEPTRTIVVVDAP